MREEDTNKSVTAALMNGLLRTVLLKWIDDCPGHLSLTVQKGGQPFWKRLRYDDVSPLYCLPFTFYVSYQSLHCSATNKNKNITLLGTFELMLSNDLIDMVSKQEL